MEFVIGVINAFFIDIKL